MIPWYECMKFPETVTLKDQLSDMELGMRTSWLRGTQSLVALCGDSSNGRHRSVSFDSCSNPESGETSKCSSFKSPTTFPLLSVRSDVCRLSSFGFGWTAVESQRRAIVPSLFHSIVKYTSVSLS
jgi:hypothetical protein